ncbi:MAG: hypothetical protein RBR15_10215 [Sphaerochaeta sp.]|nr:hypothetical protein [Sphaerochaeta sp.]
MTASGDNKTTNMAVSIFLKDFSDTPRMVMLMREARASPFPIRVNGEISGLLRKSLWFLPPRVLGIWAAYAFLMREVACLPM